MGRPSFKLFVFIALACLFLLSACGGSTSASSGAQKTTGKHYKIGFANLTEGISFTTQVRQGIEQAAKQAGNIDLVEANNNLDGATALANADNFITQQVDGVIEFQTDAKFGNVIMDKFRSHNIPVIAIDIPMPGATFFGADNYHAGFLGGQGLGQWIQKNWNGQVDALVSMELPQSGDIPAARMQGQRDGLESVVGKIPESKVKHLDSKNTLEEARKLMADVLTTLPNAHHIAVVNINDDTALGAIAAAQAAGRINDIAVAAQNATDNARTEIRKPGSRFIGSTAYFPEKYGFKIIPAMIKLINHESVPPSIYVDHVFITKDNVDKYYPGK
jgi:ribose transport system substrate-binding protein